MVIILLILTVLFFLLLDWKKLEKKNPEHTSISPKVAGRCAHPSFTWYTHPGHTWARVDQSRSVLVGTDEFAIHLIGTPDTIDLPRNGAFLRQGEPLVTFHRGHKSLTLVAPITGVVENTNELLTSSSEILNESPYEKGWIAKIHPENIAIELRNLMKGPQAVRWQEAVRQQLFQWFTPNLGTVLQDGGALINNISDLVNDEEWNRIKQEFFPNIQSDTKHILSKGAKQ